jgi:hypothetical protein
MRYIPTLLLSLCVFSPLATRAETTVPCSKVHEASTMTVERCPSPFLEGIVDGQWIGLVLHYTGGNNGVDGAAVYTVGNSAGAVKTFLLGEIKVEDNFGWTGDMEVRFVDGKLWVINPDHDYNHQSHLGFAQVLVRQYGFYGPQLVVEKRAFVPMPGSGKGFYPSNAAISAALQKQ